MLLASQKCAGCSRRTMGDTLCYVCWFFFFEWQTRQFGALAKYGQETLIRMDQWLEQGAP